MIDDPILGRGGAAVVCHIGARASTVDFGNVVCDAGLRWFGGFVDGGGELGVAVGRLAPGEGVCVAGVGDASITAGSDGGGVDDLDGGCCANGGQQGLGLDCGKCA